jgi:UTP--glucose-1-phosphate uridylyltransferase
MSDEMVKAFRGKDWAILGSEKLGAFGERLHFAEQHTPDGFGHAVYQAKKFVGDEPFLLLLGDHVYISDEQGPLRASTDQRLRAVHARRGHRRAADGRKRVAPVRHDRRHADRREQGHLQAPTTSSKSRRSTSPANSSSRPVCRRATTWRTSAWVFGPQIFDSLEYLIKNNLREKGEIQLTAAQEHFANKRTNTGCGHARPAV